MAHTPGPWRIDAELDKSVSIYAPGHDQYNRDRLECEVSTDVVNYGTAMANAHLIAAAPDLLAALERIVSINGSTGGHKAMVAEFKYIAQTAIAKARG